MHALSLPNFAAEFNGTAVSIIDHAGHKWLTAADVGRCLGYAIDRANDAITNLFGRHADEFSAEDTCTVKLMVQGQRRETRIFSATGCIKLGFFANTSLAKAFRAWASQVLAAHMQARPDSAPRPGSHALRITRALEFEALNLFVAGHTQTSIAKRLSISKGAISMALHGRYRFSPDAGVDLTTPELVSAVAKRHIEADLERLTQKYCASAANRSLEHALDDAGTHLLNQLAA